MKIKKYRTYNVQEGMAQIRKEMGPDAVIIENRKRRQKGFKGFFLPRMVEITAAVDTPQKKEEITTHNFFNSGKIMDDELGQLKNLMKKILAQQENSLSEGNSLLQYWLKRLIDNDVEREYALDVLTDIQAVSAGKENTAEVIETLILNRIGKSILTDDIPTGAKFISFVGPTGVGKTTTLVKLAANFTFRQGKKTAIITVDTYRIGAVEQLKTYAEITGIPLDVVYTLKDMQKTIDTYRDYDHIFIDTTGRSAKNPLQIAETAQYMNCLTDAVIFLVVSATTKMRDLRRITQSFQRCGYNRIILTKTDETETYGTILNVCRLTSMPITYITTGQNVPDDIESADSGRLAEMALGEEYDG